MLIISNFRISIKIRIIIESTSKSLIISKIVTYHYSLDYANNFSNFIFHFSQSFISLVCKSINFRVWS